MQETMNQIFGTMAGYIPNLIGAIAVLVIGWLIALLVSKAVRGLFSRTTIDDRLGAWIGKGDKPTDISEGLGRFAFWLIMVIVLIAFFQVMKLTIVTEPLNRFLTKLMEYLPQIIGAGILLLIAWVMASVVRFVATRAMTAGKLDERLGSKVSGSGEKRDFPLTKAFGDVLYWLVFLMFLPAILGALNLGGLLQPVQTMLDKLLSFLPNIFAAGVIGFTGWFVARILRQILSSLLSATGVDHFSEKIGIPSLSKTISLVAFILILIPVLISALNALALEAITQPASAMLTMILGALPQIFAALLVLGVAYGVGKIVSRLTAELLTGLGFNSILVRLGIGKTQETGRRTPSEFVGYLVMVAVILFAVFEASNLLGFEALSDLTAELTVFGGRILLGVIIVGVGLYLANLAAKAVQVTGTAQAGLLSSVVRVAIIVLSGSIAIRHMGLANEIINLAFGLILGAIAVAAAIAFGIGGRNIAARKLEEWTGSKRPE